MSQATENLVIGIMPEGPIAYDGAEYRYSKGERLYIDNLASNFKKIRLITFVLKQGDDAYETCIHSPFQSKNINIHEMPRPNSNIGGVVSKLLHFIKVFIFLIAVVPKVDVLFVFLPSYPSAMGWFLAKVFRKIHIVYGADDWEQASESMFKWEHLKGGWFYGLYFFLNKIMERKIVRSALFAVVAGGQLKEKYSNWGCPTYSTSPRIILSKDNVFRRDDTFLSNKKTLITVGALVHDKAHHILLSAFSCVLKKEPHLKLKIVGDGPYKSKLKLQSKALGILKSVEFVGYITDEERLYSMLKNSDLFVLSSVTEGFPRVLYEAMAFSLPIATTDVGGIPYILHDGLNARVVKSKDIDSLANAILDIISDEVLRRKIIKSGRETVEDILAKTDSMQIYNLLQKHLALN